MHQAVNLELLPFSFVAGVATFFNPCVGALLPTYVGLYFAQDDGRTVSWGGRGLQGLALGSVISAGFLTSMGALGLIFALLGSAVASYLPWVAVAVAVGIAIAGVIILIRPSVAPSLGKLVSRRLPLRADPQGGLLSFYAYGLVYAVCAAACTLPIFLSVMTQTFLAGGVGDSLLNFAAYGWGMSIMMLLFAVLLAYSKGAVYRVFATMGTWVQRASGAFMILAGGYVLYYLLIYGRYIDALIGR